ncbi:NAD(+)/NADH kinase [Desulforamulus ferrireducens]|uniref:NAD kinase n=1 Tax=Desulforamulus ferrireducens TaxID=1833852 RepID=A0A1S6IUR2_9FIRM|nr:NAD(+)/NADH kinase [Desulforamulus ferrireducens]AQS58517.1 NAD(+) kinase [Desulforamulus ferrireducens]
MNTIGLVVNSSKSNVAEPVNRLVAWLKERKVKVLYNQESAALLGLGKGLPTAELARQCDCIMVWGGDGTLLNCARQTAFTGTPIFGVNLGRLGFLTEIDIPDLRDKMQALLAGEYFIEERMMLQATVLRENQIIDQAICLNDAVVSKGASLRMVYLTMKVNGEHAGTFAADGLILASPTGSTAYSLSAGGPIITPEAQVLLITPICPHSSNRPMVIAPESEVEVEVLPDVEDVRLTLDGQHGITLKVGDKVIIKRAEVKAKFLRIHKTNFFDVLRGKLKEWQSGLD